MELGYVLLYVDDVEKSQQFYQKAFGLKPGFLHESKQYGEMETGTSKLGFVHHHTAGSHGFTYEGMTPARKPSAFEIGLVTPDVPAAYARAVEAGAIPQSPPQTKPWGQTVAYVRDHQGFLVELCSPMG